MNRPAQPDKNPFQGVILSAVTPRRRHETSIDLAASLELLDFLSRAGANGIELLGAAGEFVHFALDDRRHMMDFAVKRSRAPLLVNVSHSTLDGSVELAREAAASGVAGVFLMPPYYYRYSQDAVFEFYRDFAASTDRDLPVCIENAPEFTTPLEIATALALLDTGLFAAIKDDSGSWDYFTQLRDHKTIRPHAILTGDALFERARPAGAHGVVSILGCAVPELILAMDGAAAANEAARFDALSRRLREFMERLPFPMPLGIKQALQQRKIDVGAPAIAPATGEKPQLDDFAAWFAPWLAQVRAECDSLSKERRSGGR